MRVCHMLLKSYSLTYLLTYLMSEMNLRVHKELDLTDDRHASSTIIEY